MSKLKKGLRVFGIGILGLIVLAIIVHSIATVILGHRLKAEIAAIKARGELVSCTELGLPKIPDEENGAIIYAKAFEIVSTPQAEKDLMALDSFLDPRKRESNPELWDQARRLVARYGSVLPIVEQAQSRPKCRFAVNWEDACFVILPHYPKLRRLSRLALANAVLQAKDGNVDGAIHSLELALKIGETIKSDPTMLGPMVRASAFTIFFDAGRLILQYDGVTEVQAKRLYDMLETVDLNSSFVQAMQGERANGLWMFDWAGKHSVNEIASGRSGENGIMGFLTHGYIWRPILYADELFYLKWMNRNADQAHLTWREMQPGISVFTRDPDFPRYAIVSIVVLPCFGNARRRVDGAIAEIAGTQIVLGLTTYKHRHGAYPRTLDELRSKLGWEFREDPFSGKDFVYKRQGNGFLLYSIGANLRDDGGRAMPLNERYKLPRESRLDDIIWEFDR